MDELTEGENVGVQKRDLRFETEDECWSLGAPFHSRVKGWR